jgi:hypothetical protein
LFFSFLCLRISTMYLDRQTLWSSLSNCTIEVWTDVWAVCRCPRSDDLFRALDKLVQRAVLVHFSVISLRHSEALNRMVELGRSF